MKSYKSLIKNLLTSLGSNNNNLDEDIENMVELERKLANVN